MAFSERVTRLKSSLIRDILAAAQRPEVMSFAGGLPAERCLPAVDWSTMPAGLGQYGMSEGEPALREAIAAQARAYGLDCTADQVLVTTGSQQALDLIAKLYLDVGTPVLVEGPTYLAALQSFRGLALHALHLGAEPLLALLRQLPLLVAQPLHGLAEIAQLNLRLWCRLLRRCLRWRLLCRGLLRHGGRAERQRRGGQSPYESAAIRARCSAHERPPCGAGTGMIMRSGARSSLAMLSASSMCRNEAGSATKRFCSLSQ